MFLKNSTQLKIKWMLRPHHSATEPLAEGELDPQQTAGPNITAANEPCQLFLGLAADGKVSGPSPGYGRITNKSAITITGIETVKFKID